ncbi:hypothetical protein Tco_0768671 [Tanacetum coccineum]
MFQLTKVIEKIMNAILQEKEFGKSERFQFWGHFKLLQRFLVLLDRASLIVVWDRNLSVVSFLKEYAACQTSNGESPSSSAFVVDNLNNQATIIDKTMLSKEHKHSGNQVVARSQANFTRLLDFELKGVLKFAKISPDALGIDKKDSLVLEAIL